MSVNEERTVTIQDILEDEELQEAYAVLAGSDPDNCSYPQGHQPTEPRPVLPASEASSTGASWLKLTDWQITPPAPSILFSSPTLNRQLPCPHPNGYVKRQAVFACNTCTPRGVEPAGLCLACTNHCHDGHDIFELYTKRNFRCDCGNSKFGVFRCQLSPGKDRQNAKNHYNHNFHGCYCTCDRPYPDTEDQVNEDMIQCIICEDWYHPRHLGCTVEDSEELQEMVCETCMNKAPFLWTYATHIAEPPVVKVSPCKAEVEVNKEEDKEPDDKRMDEPCKNGGEGSSTSPSCQEKKQATNGRTACKRTHQEMTGLPVKNQDKTVYCRLRELKTQGLERAREGAVFWPYHWRAKLCTCVSCKRAYVDAGVQFLLDESDTVLAYENRGTIEQGTASLDSLLMSSLSTLDRVQQLEIVYQFNEMQSELMAFLRQLADEGKVVTAEAIHQFFGELMSRKRRQMNS